MGRRRGEEQMCFYRPLREGGGARSIRYNVLLHALPAPRTHRCSGRTALRQRPGTTTPRQPQPLEQACRDGRSPPRPSHHPDTVARENKLSGQRSGTPATGTKAAEAAARGARYAQKHFVHFFPSSAPNLAFRAGFVTVPVVKKVQIDTVEGRTTRCSIPRCVFSTFIVF